MIEEGATADQGPWQELSQEADAQKSCCFILFKECHVSGVHCHRNGSIPNKWIAKGADALIQTVSYGFREVENRANHGWPFVP